MFRRLLCGVLSLMVVAMLAAPARAGEERGSIRVTLQNGETVVPDGAVKLYYVGACVDGDFWLTESFGGGLVKYRDAMSPALAQWLAEMAGKNGEEKVLDEEGSAEFTNLPQGLYLVVQSEQSTGYHLMEPMTVMLPCEYQWHIQAFPKTEEIIMEIPLTAQTPIPYFGIAGMLLSGTGLVLCGIKRRKR